MIKKILIKVGLFLILIGLFIISYKSASVFIESYKKDLNNSRVIIDTIKIDYYDFNNKAKNIKQGIINVSNNLNLYYKDFYNNNMEILNGIKIVENDINLILETAYSLYENCKYDLNDNEIKNMCNVYSINYKAVVNSYLKMINEYNKVVNLYNNYATENNLNNISLYLINDDNELFKFYNIVSSEG